jgi:hypothetical protein
MLKLDGKNGELQCAADLPDACVLDGNWERRIIHLTSSTTITIRSITFLNGYAVRGGGIYVQSNSVATIELCKFESCTATGTSGGGAISVSGTGEVTLYANSFSGNQANVGAGDDIRSLGTLKIFASCPDPYQSNTPITGEALDMDGTLHVDSDGEGVSYTGCFADPCVASTSSSDDGSDGNFYCVNGGSIGGYGAFCTCTCPATFGGTHCDSCAVGYGGDSCSAESCKATSTSTDDGSDGNFYCINGGEVGGTTGSCTCTSCTSGFDGVNCASPHQISDMNFIYDMDGFFNTISNDTTYADNTGNSIMPNGDTAVLAVGVYQCSDGPCAGWVMLYTSGLNGILKCLEDDASCILNGEQTRRGMSVGGTGAGSLLLRALTFKGGEAAYGGGVHIQDRAIVTIELCVFSNCRATDSSWGGGAIWVQDSGTTVNTYGTSFNDNTADSGNGDDIYRAGGTITIHNTCPSPYSSNTPTQGELK